MVANRVQGRHVCGRGLSLLLTLTRHLSLGSSEVTSFCHLAWSHGFSSRVIGTGFLLQDRERRRVFCCVLIKFGMERKGSLAWTFACVAPAGVWSRPPLLHVPENICDTRTVTPYSQRGCQSVQSTAALQVLSSGGFCHYHNA